MKDFQRLIIKDLTKAFGDKTALSKFSLDVSHGEFVTFLGPSGCGKSTALNCIAGLLPITRGEIFIDGECIDGAKEKIPPEKREFGMVFQNYALFPHLTVFQNVAFGLTLRRLPKAAIKEKVKNALTMVHLDGYDTKYPMQMSGGEQQRVAIARAIVLQPRLLMLDEPLSNLDAKLRLEMRNEILALHTRLGVTTIYVTHDQQEALALSDRIVVLRSGLVQQVGKPAEVYSDPANLFVADFMGFKNIWSARIEGLKQSESAVDAAVDMNGIKLSARLHYAKGDARRAVLVAAYEDKKPVKTAIRPEEIQIAAHGDAGCVPAKVMLVEYQGQSTSVSAMLKNDSTVEFRTTQHLHVGDTVDLSIKPEKVFLVAENGR